MPVVSSPNLTLTTSEGQVTVRVRYDVTFNAFERSLAGLGKTWHSHITVHGIDGAVVGPSITAVDFPTRTFPVTAGTNLTFTFCDRAGAKKASTVVVSNSGRPRQAGATSEQGAACVAGLADPA